MTLWALYSAWPTASVLSAGHPQRLAVVCRTVKSGGRGGAWRLCSVVITTSTVWSASGAAAASASAFVGKIASAALVRCTGPADVSTAVESRVAQLLREHEPNLPPAGLYQRVLDRVEAPLIAMALNACGGNQIKAAELLGLNRNTLRKKIRAHSIEIVKQSRRG